ncbi:hypothetical protein B0F90DRAFT_1672571 [Multifurca ochricompacta]|uniref:Uncharacterized protein n=1 Tax=Multifurca ochricompacta TaxID=376703 RepID=A0AAD4LTA4_9AGAM|nr:hypothetical protein B0F90DRAFT_1672571 [Multifurca ochricompacta]
MASSQTHENTRNHSESLKPSHFAIVVCIGAGSYGILTAIHFAWEVPNIKLTVYEKERRIGGTCVRHFPVVARSQAGYLHSFETNVDWSGFYASGPEILVTSIEWSKMGHHEEGGWEECEGLGGYKAIGIIGNGSSGIQLVIAHQSLVKSIVNYILSKTWIGEPFSLRAMLELAGCDPGSDNYLYSEKDREALRDEKYYKEFRHKIEADLNTTIRGSDLQKLVGWRTIQGRNEETTRCTSGAHRENGLTVYRAVLALSRPQLAVCCRRLTPGPATWKLYARKIRHSRRHQPHASHLQGIELEDGSAEHIDVLVCATGFDVSYCFPFTVLRRDGLAFNAHWAATGGAEAYLSIAVDDFPNLFVRGGPNLAMNSGSVEYAAFLRRRSIRIVVVRWYKNAEGRVIALRSVVDNVSKLSSPKNQLAWLGDGQTYNEKVGKGDLAWYLDENELDYLPGKPT